MLSIALITAGVASWLIGGHLLIAYHYRRIGKRQPFFTSFIMFKRFNTQEWTAFAAMILLGFLLLYAAHSVGA